jgi:hypothetical protein
MSNFTYRIQFAALTIDWNDGMLEYWNNAASPGDDEKEETTDYADYTDFFVLYFCVFRVFRGSFSKHLKNVCTANIMND